MAGLVALYSLSNVIHIAVQCPIRLPYPPTSGPSSNGICCCPVMYIFQFTMFGSISARIANSSDASVCLYLCQHEVDDACCGVHFSNDEQASQTKQNHFCHSISVCTL